MKYDGYVIHNSGQIVTVSCNGSAVAISTNDENGKREVFVDQAAIPRVIHALMMLWDEKSGAPAIELTRKE